MKISNPKILLALLIVVLAIAIISNVYIHLLFAAPGGSAYAVGFPVTYHIQYCGGYAPCYWSPFYLIGIIENIAFWLIASAIIFFGAKYLMGRKKKLSRI
jgi:hypothetical protein